MGIIANDGNRYRASWIFILGAMWFLSPLLLLASERHSPPPLRVAAASDLRFALDEVIAEFKKIHPEIAVDVTYGSSGNLKSQIEHGAPFDLFLSADIRFPEALIAAGKADAGDLFSYAVGRLVIWVRSDSPLDPESQKHEVLLDPTIRKIAIANPEHAPYGQAAAHAMKHFDIYDSVASKLVLGENIAQTAQFVDSGAADVGILALSLAIAPAMKERGRYWKIPMDAFPRMVQGGIIIGATTQRERAMLLRTALLSEPGPRILKRFGFILPDDRLNTDADANH